jgi:hypothetical protein
MMIQRPYSIQYGHVATIPWSSQFNKTGMHVHNFLNFGRSTPQVSTASLTQLRLWTHRSCFKTLVFEHASDYPEATRYGLESPFSL